MVSGENEGTWSSEKHGVDFAYTPLSPAALGGGTIGGYCGQGL